MSLTLYWKPTKDTRHYITNDVFLGNNISVSHKIMDTPSISFQLPTEVLMNSPIPDAQFEFVLTFDNGHIFHGITERIDSDHVTGVTTIQAVHVATELQHRRVPTNYAIKELTLGEIYTYDEYIRPASMGEGGEIISNQKPREEDKKDNKESVKETDKKEGPKGQTVPENKQEVPSKETPKVTSDKIDSSSNKKQETSQNNAQVENKVLSATLSGRDIAVSFDKNKIKADDVFVGAINDEKLNKTIIEKLGSEYKVIEVFEIHFKKDGKKIDSDAERTVKVSVVKNDNAELEVYHIADNNVLEKVESSFSDGSLQFKINHFSKFTILERIRVGAKDLESRVQIVTPVKAEYKAENKKEDSNNSNKVNNDKKEETNKKEKEELPKTGLESEQTISMALLALAGAIAVRRKQKQ